MSAGVTFVQLQLRAEEVAALDRYRGDQPNPPSRVKAMHQIVRDGLRNHFFARESNHVAAR